MSMPSREIAAAAKKVATLFGTQDVKPVNAVIKGLSNGAMIALNAIGVTLVYSAVRTINFAYGDLFALTTVLISSLIGSLGLRLGIPFVWLIGGLALVLLAGMTLAIALNVAVERIAFRPFRARSRLAPLIATIGLSFVL